MAFFTAEAERRKKWDAINSGLVSTTTASAATLPALLAEAGESKAVPSQSNADIPDEDNSDLNNDQESVHDNVRSDVSEQLDAGDSGEDEGLVAPKPLPQEIVAKKRKLIVVSYVDIIISLKTLNEYVSSCFKSRRNRNLEKGIC